MKGKRQCPRCGFWFDKALRTCPDDGASMVQARWVMDARQVQFIHVLALREKGLTVEEYKLRMEAVTTKTTCKDLTRRDFHRFVADLRTLPDAPGARYGMTRRAA